MAQHPDKTREIARLLEQSAASRVRLSRELGLLKRRLDAPARALRAVRSHPLRWLGGTLAAGVSLAWLFRRKAQAPIRPVRLAGAWLWPLLFSAVQPALKALLFRKVQGFLTERLAQSEKTLQHLPADSSDGVRRPAIFR